MLVSLVTAAALALSGCSTAVEREPEMDAAAIQSELVMIDGVTDASVGTYNTGAPGSNALRTKLVVDDAGLADLPGVLDAAIDVVADDAPGFTSYEFAVSAVDPSSPTGTRRVSLSKQLTADQVPGTLGTSLTLTPAELQAAAS
jgi:hypothetical protein